MTTTKDDYVLSTGDVGASRLRLVNEVYGRESERLLLRAGLKEGMSVVDVGCGIGTMSHWMASQVGPSGRVVGVDANLEQLERAQAKASTLGLRNVVFMHVSAYDLAEIGHDIDLVYSRLLFMHLSRPLDALRAMRSLLAPAGVIVCEEASVESSFCEPSQQVQKRLQELAIALAKQRDCDFNVANRLYALVRASGFSGVEISQHQPIFARGEAKRLEELSFLEVSEHVARSGLASTEELQAMAKGLYALTHDEAIVYSLSRMTQVWAHR